MRTRWCAILAAAALAATIPRLPGATPPDDEHRDADESAQAVESFSLDWHAINPGIARARSNCFQLAGTLGQPVAGYATGGSFIVSAGFWAGAPTSGLDTIFFHGFEGCGA
ncbi:MAG: hypothetical protein GXC76_11580 [Rhodanobacteraceae bacterium]|jgi:hypothetical protein|nr:hypothetical protein [Rhodanobacteraceae bacterium]